MEKIKPYAFLALGALLFTLGFPNIFGIYLPIASVMGTAILLHYLFKPNTTKKRIGIFLGFNLVVTLLSFYWITNTLQEFGNLPFVVAGFLNLCFSLVFNPQYWILIFALFAIHKYKKEWESQFFNSGLSNVVLAVALTSIEYYIPNQFPVMLGQPWIIFSEYLGLADVFGLPMFSFMGYLSAAEIVRAKRHKKLSIFNISSIIVFVLINPLFNPTADPQNLKKDPVDFNVRLVQANISNFLKVDSEKGGYASVSEVLGRYKELSNKKEEGFKPDLIVWPETAYPYGLNTEGIELSEAQIPQVFQDIAFEMNSEIFFGGYDHFREDPTNPYFQTDYNSGLFLNKSATLTKIYHKQVLIPFGETLPLGPLNKVVSDLVPEMAFFAVGSSFPLFKTEVGVKFISSICYEILRPEFARDYLNALSSKPHLMINLTNDSWYGNTVEPEQHLFLTKWRAIEFRMPILRSTNTGISTYIDRFGKELKRLDYEVTGNLDLSLQFDKNTGVPTTTFQKFGFWANLPIWILYFIFHLLLIKFYYAKNN